MVDALGWITYAALITTPWLGWWLACRKGKGMFTGWLIGYVPIFGFIFACALKPTEAARQRKEARRRARRGRHYRTGCPAPARYNNYRQPGRHRHGRGRRAAPRTYDRLASDARRHRHEHEEAARGHYAQAAW